MQARHMYYQQLKNKYISYSKHKKVEIMLKSFLHLFYFFLPLFISM